MAVTNYGNIRLADVSPNDVEIFYTYAPDRNTLPSGVAAQLPSTLLNPVMKTGSEVLGGMYNIKLPKENFKNKGIYNILLRPRQMRVAITNCGVLSALPQVKGIVIDRTELESEGFTFSNNSLNGFLIEYLEDDGTRVRNISRIVTSSNLCEPITEAINNTSDKAVRYRFTPSGSLIFLTLTPSSESIVSEAKANSNTFIGVPGQNIIVSNTFFNPVMIEVEMVEHDVETISYALYGNQTKSMQDGDYTIYDNEDEIYAQYKLYEIVDEAGNPLYEVRERKSRIDESKDFDEIIKNVNNI